MSRPPRSCDPIRGAVSGFRILGGGSLASSLDLRCTRKSALDLPPGKLRSDPPSFGCCADSAPLRGVITGIRKNGDVPENSSSPAAGAAVVQPAAGMSVIGDPGRCGGVDEAAGTLLILSANEKGV